MSELDKAAVEFAKRQMPPLNATGAYQMRDYCCFIEGAKWLLEKAKEIAEDFDHGQLVIREVEKLLKNKPL